MSAGHAQFNRVLYFHRSFLSLPLVKGNEGSGYEVDGKQTSFRHIALIAFKLQMIT